MPYLLLQQLLLRAVHNTGYCSLKDAVSERYEDCFHRNQVLLVYYLQAEHDAELHTASCSTQGLIPWLSILGSYSDKHCKCYCRKPHPVHICLWADSNPSKHTTPAAQPSDTQHLPHYTV